MAVKPMLCLFGHTESELRVLLARPALCPQCFEYQGYFQDAGALPGHGDTPRTISGHGDTQDTETLPGHSTISGHRDIPGHGVTLRTWGHSQDVGTLLGWPVDLGPPPDSGSLQTLPVFSVV